MRKMTLQKQAEQQLNSTEKSMAAPRRDNPIFPPPPPYLLRSSQLRRQCTSLIPIAQCEATIRTVLNKSASTITILRLPPRFFSFPFALLRRVYGSPPPLQIASREQRHLCNRCSLYTLAHRRGLFLTLETTPARQGFSTLGMPVKVRAKPCRSCCPGLSRPCPKPSRSRLLTPKHALRACPGGAHQRRGPLSLVWQKMSGAHPGATTAVLYRYAIHCPNSPFLQTQALQVPTYLPIHSVD